MLTSVEAFPIFTPVFVTWNSTKEPVITVKEPVTVVFPLTPKEPITVVLPLIPKEPVNVCTSVITLPILTPVFNTCNSTADPVITVKEPVTTEGPITFKLPVMIAEPVNGNEEAFAT